MTDNLETRLVVYGSLAPGEANHFLVAGLVGVWRRCQIRGYLGNYRGFKSFRYDPKGPEHPAWLLESSELPGVISDLDGFEGEEYQRSIILAKLGEQWVMAQVYEGKYCD
ncbi:MAG: gamma-glutamylcyclotransferase family protein [Desulfobaccales bacterium]